MSFAYSTLFLIAFYYLSYRYPLQIGDDNTSPTYGPTPLVIQIMKYVSLSAVILLILNFQGLKFRSSNLLVPLISVFSIFSLMICVIFVPVDFGATTRFFEIGFTLIFSILLASANNIAAVNAKFIKILTIFFWFNVANYVIQLLLFNLIGRLPALAYEDGNVRFGGVWDDPNSAFVPFLLYTTYCIFRDGKTKRNAVLVFLSFSALFFAQSVTAIAAAMLTTAVMYFWFWEGATAKTKLLRAAVSAVGLAIIGLITGLVVSAIPIFDFSGLMDSFETFMEIKEGSAATRGNTYSIVSDAKFMTFIGLDPVLTGGENSYVNILVNFGALLLVVFILIQILTIRALYLWTRNPIDKEDYCTAMAFSAFFIWYVVSMMNLPLAEVFPDNVLAAIVSGAAIAATARSAKKRRPRRPAVGRIMHARRVKPIGAT